MTHQREFIIGGKYKTIRQLASEYGIKPSTLRSRLSKGLSLTNALSKSPEFKPRKSRAPKRYLYEGQQLTIAEIAARTGLSVTTIQNRRCGVRVMSTEEVRAMEREPGFPHFLNVGGKHKSIAELARQYGIKEQTIYCRLRKGWPLAAALTFKPVRHQHTITHDGRTQTLSAWARETGIEYHTLRNRLREGWPTPAALTIKPVPPKHTLTYGGRTQSLSAWAKQFNLDPTTLKQRIDELGWPIERALNEPTHNRGQRTRRHINTGGQSRTSPHTPRTGPVSENRDLHVTREQRRSDP